MSISTKAKNKLYLPFLGSPRTEIQVLAGGSF
jgi:hypothetical protein